MQTSNEMNNQKPHLYFLLVILAGSSVLVFLLFRPFLYALILATVFAVIFQPVYKKISKFTHRWQGLAALATILIIAIFILAPLIFLGIQIFQEAQQLYFSLVEGTGKDTVLNIVSGATDKIQSAIGEPTVQKFSVNINQYLKLGLSWLIQHLGSAFAGLAKITLSAFIFLIALYYLLKDGQKLKTTIIALSPLNDSDDEAIFLKLEKTIDSIVEGRLFVAIIQGALMAIGFAIFGVPNAILWGSTAAIAALIPGIGTALVLIPAVTFLFLTSELFLAIGLLVWGVVIVGLVDNILGPKLIGDGTQLHPFIILLAVFGGIGLFGPIGFLLGPLTISLFFVLLDIYFSLMKKNNCK